MKDVAGDTWHVCEYCLYSLPQVGGGRQPVSVGGRSYGKEELVAWDCGCILTWEEGKGMIIWSAFMGSK